MAAELREGVALQVELLVLGGDPGVADQNADSRVLGRRGRTTAAYLCRNSCQNTILGTLFTQRSFGTFGCPGSGFLSRFAAIVPFSLVCGTNVVSRVLPVGFCAARAQ